jgi:GT2 family glycosyltransferase
MKNNIVVVFSSHLSEEENQKFIKHIDDTIGVKHNVVCYPNFNQFSLSQIYNDAIKKHKVDDCIFVMCHNDITIKTKGWGKLLLTKFNNSNFDIIGVAGSTYMPASGMWWEDHTKMVGIVEHTDGYQTWISQYSQEILGIKETVIIDGLFMAFDPDSIVHGFDENFKGFHFYDLAFCIPNYLDGCNIGVTTVIRILHQSIGQTNQQWENSRIQFAQTYADELPLSVLPEHKEFSIKLKENPKVSVIIPTKNNYKYIVNNINSWKEHVQYPNYEIIIADTGSDEDTIKKYDEFLDERVKLVRYNWYNFGKINNDVVKNHVSSDTELILFCNDDIKLLNDALSRCVEIYLANKDNVGTIGIRLHYGDGSIQHNGMIAIIDAYNRPIFSHRELKKSDNYFNGINYNSIGNTGGFMLISRDLFTGLGYFNENYLECLEDVELNLKCKLLGLNNITVSDAVAYHYESISRNKIAGGNSRFEIDYHRLISFTNNHNIVINNNNIKFLKLETLEELNGSVLKTKNNVLVNIITRTHNRPKYFKVCKESIEFQTYKNINHVVGSDVDCDYCDYIKLELQEVQPKPDYLASYPAPWNLHLNTLNTYVKDGWIMYLDDDDKFVNSDALETIVNNIENEDQIILWRVDINGMIVPNTQGFGKIEPGNISGIGFMFHSKHLPVDWGSWNFGDYRVITQLVNKKLQQKWINFVLTQTQGSPNFGQQPKD